MAYRKTTRYTKQLATMREAKARKRLADPAPGSADGGHNSAFRTNTNNNLVMYFQDGIS